MTKRAKDHDKKKKSRNHEKKKSRRASKTDKTLTDETASQNPSIYFDTENKEVLTNFLKDLGNALLEYRDEDLKNVTITFERELSKLYETATEETKGPADEVYKTLFSDQNIQRYALNQAKYWAKLDAGVLRDMIHQSLEETNEGAVARVVRGLNGMYDEKDAEKFAKMVTVIKMFPEVQKDLSRAVKKALEYVVFDRYKHSDSNDRDILLSYIQELGIHAKKQNIEYESRDNTVDKVFRSSKTSEEMFKEHDKIETNDNSHIENISPLTSSKENENDKAKSNIEKLLPALKVSEEISKENAMQINVANSEERYKENMEIKDSKVENKQEEQQERKENIANSEERYKELEKMEIKDSKVENTQDSRDNDMVSPKFRRSQGKEDDENTIIFSDSKEKDNRRYGDPEENESNNELYVDRETSFLKNAFF